MYAHKNQSKQKLLTMKFSRINKTTYYEEMPTIKLMNKKTTKNNNIEKLRTKLIILKIIILVIGFKKAKIGK